MNSSLDNELKIIQAGVNRVRRAKVEENKDISMNANEEKFAKLFNDYKTKPSVNAMSDLELRAHREELSDIAFSAKAYVYAVDEILKERKPKGPQGFEKSLNSDAAASDVINAIKERQKRMSKSEKLQSNLKDMFAKAGMSLEDAEKEAKRLMQAGTILEQINKSKAETETVTDTVIKADDDKLNNAERNEADEPKKLFNPFEKK